MNIYNYYDKTIITSLFLVLLSLFLFSLTNSTNVVHAQPSGEVVNFPDRQFEIAVREQIGKMSGTIDSSELMFINDLRIESRGIRDLTGIQYFPNLDYLSASNNNIQDLTPLSGHPSLRNANLGDNLLSDLSPLATIPNLEYLYLWNNRITDISSLRGASKLRSIYMSNNMVNDLTPLVDMPRLRELGIEENPSINNVDMLQPLANTTIEYLNIDGLRINSLGPITSMLNLKRLDISDTQIIDIAGIDKLSGLEDLDVSGLRLKDYSPIKNLPFLENLSISKFNWTNAQLNNFISPGSFQYLERFTCWQCSLTDISFVKNLPFITHLELHDNNLSDISPVYNLQYLDTLTLERNNIRDITGFADMMSFGNNSYIRIYDNPLTAESIQVARDLENRGVNIDYPQFATPTPTPLPTPTPTPPANAVLFNDYNLEKGIRKEVGLGQDGYILKKDVAEITRLELDNLSIYDISGIEQLPNLNNLRLPNNNITDISPLKNVKKLKKLKLNNNNIRDLSPLYELKLEKIDVFGNNISDLNLNPANLKHIIDLNIGNNNFNDANQLFEVLGQLENVQKLGLFNIEPIDNLGWMSNGVFNTDSGEEGLWRLNIIGTSITDISDLSSLSNFTDGISVEGEEPRFGYNNECLSDESKEKVQSFKIDTNDMPDPNNCGFHNTTSSNQNFNNNNNNQNFNNNSGFPTFNGGSFFQDPQLEQAIMQEVGFSYDMLSDLNALSGINAINLSGRQIYSLEGIQTLMNLTEIDISNNNIEDLWWLESLYNLEHINISNNPIYDIGMLRNFPRLRWLDMSRINNNNLWDLTGGNLGSSLETLIVYQSGIDDSHMDALTNLYNLREFIAPENNISRVDSLRGLNNFANGGQIILSNNGIYDLGPLYDNPSLCCGLTLEIMNNPLDQNSFNNIANELRNRGVNVVVGESQYTNNQNYSSQTSTNVFGTDIGYTGGGAGNSFYYEDEGNSRGFLFNVDNTPEWATSLGLTDFNTLLDPTVIAMLGIFITLLGTVAQMARGR